MIRCNISSAEIWSFTSPIWRLSELVSFCTGSSFLASLSAVLSSVNKTWSIYGIPVLWTCDVCQSLLNFKPDMNSQFCLYLVVNFISAVVAFFRVKHYVVLIWGLANMLHYRMYGRAQNKCIFNLNLDTWTLDDLVTLFEEEWKHLSIYIIFLSSFNWYSISKKKKI